MAHKEGVAFFQDRQPHRGRIHKAMSKMLDLGGGGIDVRFDHVVHLLAKLNSPRWDHPTRQRHELESVHVNELSRVDHDCPLPVVNCQ